MNTVIHCSGCGQLFYGEQYEAAQNHAFDEHPIAEFPELFFTDVEQRPGVLLADGGTPQ